MNVNGKMMMTMMMMMKIMFCCKREKGRNNFYNRSLKRRVIILPNSKIVRNNCVIFKNQRSILRLYKNRKIFKKGREIKINPNTTRKMVQD
jgi:hypothetical protein